MSTPSTMEFFSLLTAQTFGSSACGCGGDEGVRIRRVALRLPSQADARFSNPMDVQKAARDFRGVNFIVPHFGAGYFRETLLLAAHCPNVYLDTSSANGWLRYMPYPMDLKLVCQRTLYAVGPERLIFGTDSSWFPRGFRREILEEQLSILEVLGMAKADVQRIMGGNMARLLRLA